MTKKTKQGRLDASTMFPLMELYEDSEMTQKQFCVEMDLVPHTFTYWLTKYRKSKQPTKKTVVAGKFVELEVEAPKTKGEAVRHMRISYPDGTLIELPV